MNLFYSKARHNINNLNISIMNTECLNCGKENAYHDGVKYVCPDYDYEWDDNLFFFDEDD